MVTLPQSPSGLSELTVLVPFLRLGRCDSIADVGKLFWSLSACAASPTWPCGFRDSTTHHASESQEQTNRSPNVPNWIRPTPPTTPVRAHSYHPKVITRTHSHGVHDTPPPSPAISVPSQISDQPLSTHNFSSTSSPELAGSGRRARMTAQPSLSPSEAHRTSGRIPTRRGGVPGVADLHPNLALVSRNESRLSHSGNKISNGSGLNALKTSVLR
jgi:hypothetical protein